ncbi:SGNH/GDSL hydrolase family protein [Streptomyces lasalocidi]
MALGDSYSSGVGAGDYLPGRKECKRSSRSYPMLWAAAHRTAAFAFPACNGAKVGDVLGGQLGALGPRTRLVTLTVGGSDVGFGSAMAICALGGPVPCLTAVSQARTIMARALPRSLDRLYSAIRDRAPAAHVVVLGYPHLYHLRGTCRGGLQDAERAAIDSAVDRLDAVIAGRATGHGFAFADVRAAFMRPRDLLPRPLAAQRRPVRADRVVPPDGPGPGARLLPGPRPGLLNRGRAGYSSTIHAAADV